MSRATNYRGLLDKYGVSDLNGLRVKNRDWFNQQKIKIANNKNINQKTKDKAIAKLTRQEQRSLDKLNDAIAISLGQFKKRTAADPLLRMSNQFNVATLFGSVVLSAIGDPVTAFIKNSVPNVIMNGWLSAIRRLVLNTGKYKRRDFDNAMTAISNSMDDLVRYMMNPDAGSYMVGRGEKVAQQLGRATMVGSGMTTWNNFWQKVSHDIAEKNILRYAAKETKSGTAYLNEIGLSQENAQKILQLQKKYGETVRGELISNSHLWGATGNISTQEAQELAKLFNNAIRTEVRKSPIMTDLLDLGRFWQRNEVTRSMSLGMGFGMAATNKVLLSAIARHDVQAATGIVGLVMAGMVARALLDKLNGRESDYSTSEWILNGIERSGVAGNLLNPFFQGKYAYDRIKKYGDRAWVQDPIDYLVGPNARIVRSMISHGNSALNYALGNTESYEISKEQEYRDRTLTLFNNVWWFKALKKE
jgi:hypothetical protein